MIIKGAPLTEDFGEALARWQVGEDSSAPPADPNRKKTPEEMVDAYVAAIGAIDSLDALRDYQLQPARAAWVAKVKEKRADLHDRITTANTRRANELAPIDNDPSDSSAPSDKADAGPTFGRGDVDHGDQHLGDISADRGSDSAATEAEISLANARRWADGFVRDLSAAVDAEHVDDMARRAGRAIGKMKTEHPAIHAEIEAAIDDAKSGFSAPASSELFPSMDDNDD